MTNDEIVHWLAIILGTGGIGTVAMYLRWFLTRLMADRVAAAGGREQISLLSSLREEAERSRINERAALDREQRAFERERLAVHEKNDVMATVGAMRQQIAFLTQQVSDLNLVIDSLRARIEFLITRRRDDDSTIPPTNRPI